jgi:hypothetical protein
VSLVAHYLSRNNPKGKILLFDSNPDILAKRGLFLSLWRERYPGMVTYDPNAGQGQLGPGGLPLA